MAGLTSILIQPNSLSGLPLVGQCRWISSSPFHSLPGSPSLGWPSALNSGSPNYGPIRSCQVRGVVCILSQRKQLSRSHGIHRRDGEPMITCHVCPSIRHGSACVSRAGSNGHDLPIASSRVFA